MSRDLVLRVYRAALGGALGGWIGPDLSANLGVGIGGSASLRWMVLGASVGVLACGLAVDADERMDAAALGTIAGAAGGLLAGTLEALLGEGPALTIAAWVVLGSAMGLGLSLNGTARPSNAWAMRLPLGTAAGSLAGLVAAVLPEEFPGAFALIPGGLLGALLAFSPPIVENGRDSTGGA